jgi:hypothetical protein
MNAALFKRSLWSLIAIGTLIRLLLAHFGTGVEYDLHSEEIVYSALRRDALHLYTTVNTVQQSRWPYPPGYLPWIAFAGAAFWSHFRLLMHVPPIVADAAVAWLVADFLGRRGADYRARLVAAGLVALGPSFIAISGYHGQIDSVAILPAVAALRQWELGDPRHRALWSGLLIGVGAAIKTVPLLLLLALVPAVRARREAVTLVAAAVAVPLLLTAPFLFTTLHATLHSLTYRGLPGYGGISLLVQPDLARMWLLRSVMSLNAVNGWLFHHGALVTVPALSAMFAVLWRRRVNAVDASVVMWLAVYVFGVNLFLQYLPWGLPFFLMAGHLKRSAQLQAFLLIPTLIVYAAPWSDDNILLVYVPMMIAVWAGFVVALIVLLRRPWASGGQAQVPAGREIQIAGRGVA